MRRLVIAIPVALLLGLVSLGLVSLLAAGRAPQWTSPSFWCRSDADLIGPTFARRICH